MILDDLLIHGDWLEENDIENSLYKQFLNNLRIKLRRDDDYIDIFGLINNGHPYGYGFGHGYGIVHGISGGMVYGLVNGDGYSFYGMNNGTFYDGGNGYGKGIFYGRIDGGGRGGGYSI